MADIESSRERAERHVEAGNWEMARAEWLRALAVVPDSADIMLEISYVESMSGGYLSAREWVLRAACAKSYSTDAVLTILRRLCNFNEVSVLRDIAYRLLADQATPARVLVECARQLSILNDSGLAMDCAQAGQVKDTLNPIARIVRGQLYAQRGQTAKAEEDFNWALTRHPRLATAWWMLARLRKQTRESNHIAQLHGLLKTPGLQASDIAAISRALHKELDDIGDFEGAWVALQLQCSAMRSQIRYDPKEIHDIVDALIAWSPGVDSEQVDLSQRSSVPIFIIGMYRSGTTLLEQLLGASPKIAGMGELYDFVAALRAASDYHYRVPIDAEIIRRAPDFDYKKIGQNYLEGISFRINGESHFTDKQPFNFLNVGFICSALPHAKILHMVRDPVETCFSNLRELFSDVNRYSYDQLELADYFLQYRRLMAHWHRTYPGRILDVRYAELTQDTEAAMQRVSAFCGIDYVPEMTDPRNSRGAVATASAVQVRDKVVRRDIPKWAPYAHHLQPLVNALRTGGIEIGS